MTTAQPVDPAEREVLLVEYQKAQDSAEHHDNLVGSVTSLWLGSVVFIGFVLGGMESKTAADHKAVLYPVIALGLFLTWLVWTWAEHASKLKKQKYERCKEIERILGMKQHRDVGDARRWQDWAYVVLLGLVAMAWLALLVDVQRL